MTRGRVAFEDVKMLGRVRFARHASIRDHHLNVMAEVSTGIDRRTGATMSPPSRHHNRYEEFSTEDSRAVRGSTPGLGDVDQ